MKINNPVSAGLPLSVAIALLLISAPAQAGGYLHFGYSHYGGHYGFGHTEAYGYSHPYYGLHNYYGYGHGYGHHSYGYGYPIYRHHGYGYARQYGDDYSSSADYRNQNYERRNNNSGNGWTLLGNNQASAALTDFGKQAQASPSKGGPKVGYALASAQLGRLDKGVWAMRRALRIDPRALHYVTLDTRLDAKVEYIIRQYEKQLAYSRRDSDAAFMLASLHYLRRNLEAARSNIDQAMQARHIHTSTKNLLSLIDQASQ